MAAANSSRTERLTALSREFVHKLHNALNAMHFSIALLQKASEANATPTVKQQLAKLERGMEKLEHLGLAYASLVTPEDAPTEQVDVTELVTEVLQLTAAECQAASIVTVAEVAPDLPPALGDRERLRDALLRLVANAREAMRPGGKLTVRADRDVGGRQVVLEVMDTGCGIPAADLPRVCQPFFTTKPDTLGLSLAVVKRRVEAYGGEVAITSQPGRGTTFTLRLPTAARRKAALARKVQREQWQ